MLGIYPISDDSTSVAIDRFCAHHKFISLFAHIF
nr:MAG TPA: hypothetical protein [Bacteriophage sp.]